MMVDITKKYKTRLGEVVELLTTNGKGDFPVIGQYHRPGGGWHTTSWTALGRKANGVESLGDLVEVPWHQATGVEARVCEDIAKRQQLGMSKYGMTVEDNPAKFVEWLQHAYEEVLDLGVYLKKAIEKHTNDSARD